MEICDTINVCMNKKRGDAVLDGRKVIGVCCATVNKEPSKPLVDGLAELLKDRADYRMLVFQCFEDLYGNSRSNTGSSSVFSLINYDMIDVMVMVPDSLHSRTVVEKIAEDCRSNNVPLISVDIPIEGAYSVSFGYGEAFSAIVDHILGWHSCRRIKLVAGQKGNDFSETRVKCCRDLMAKYGLTLNDDDIYYCDFWEGPTYAAMDRFFESGEPLPEAFICCNDTMAMSVCLKLNEHGVRVPEDVFVTGFDGIKIEQYHKPRLTTAVRNNAMIAEKLLELADGITSGEYPEPFDAELSYEPVFSESCGCAFPDQGNSNRLLADFVQSYAYALNYEEHVNNMENRIAADPSPGNVRSTLDEYCFRNSVICLTEEYCRCFTDSEEHQAEFTGFGNMRVFLNTFTDGRNTGSVDFPAKRLMPLLENSFSEYNTLFIVPLHFQDRVIGYLVTHYAHDEHHNERMYTLCNSLNRCFETMRLHEQMANLNRQLEFMFTHDHLTQIYNRYGFYKSFRENCAKLEGKYCDVFIVSIDLNDMKYINDNFGHSAGDNALCITAKALTGAAEECGDVICSRFGGDEFVAAKVCCGDAREQSERYRDAFVRVLGELNSAAGAQYQVHVGLGVYSADLDGVDSIESLIELADRLMYSDKAKHKRHPRN